MLSPYFKSCAEKSAQKLLELYEYARKKGFEMRVSNELEAYYKLAWMQRTGRLDCVVTYEVAVEAYHRFIELLRRRRYAGY